MPEFEQGDDGLLKEAGMTRPVSRRRVVWSLIAAAVLGMSLATSVHAAGTRYGEIVISDAKGGAEKAVFGATTPKIYVTAEIDGVTTATKLTSKWIAEKTKVAPPNYEIDTADVTASPMMNEAVFSLSKPDQGWPAGDYRVDLLINGKLAEAVRFKVAP